MIQHPLEIPRAIHEAFHIARTGRPGPVRGRHPAGPVARGHRRTSRSPTCACPATSRRPRATRSRSARPPRRWRRAAPGDLRGRRRRQRRTPSAELIELATSRPLPGHLHADGPRRVPGAARAVARDARHARHARGQLRDGRGRPDLRDRRALRRPHHRQAVGVRAAGEVHPHRRRPGRDLQERARRTSRSSATPSNVLAAADRRVPRARAPTRRGWTSGGRGSTAGSEQHPLRYEDSDRRRDQAAVHDPGAVRGDRRRGDRHQRRRPAPDVGGAVLPLPRAAPLDQLRRPRHDGLRPAGGDGRHGRLPRPDRRAASPATARSR